MLVFPLWSFEKGGRAHRLRHNSWHSPGAARLPSATEHRCRLRPPRGSDGAPCFLRASTSAPCPRRPHAVCGRAQTRATRRAGLFACCSTCSRLGLSTIVFPFSAHATHSPSRSRTQVSSCKRAHAYPHSVGVCYINRNPRPCALQPRPSLGRRHSDIKPQNMCTPANPTLMKQVHPMLQRITNASTEHTQL